MPILEGNTRFFRSIQDLPRAVTMSSASSALVAALMGVTGPALLVYQAAVDSRLTDAQTGSWFFAIYVGGGVFSILLALAYRQPICGAYSIAGAALLIPVLPQFGIEQAVGAYLISGVLITVLGLSGAFERVMRFFPASIVLAMLTGVLLRFGIAIFVELAADPLLVGPVIVSFCLMMRLGMRAALPVPPITIALVVGVVLAVLLHPLPDKVIPLSLTVPVLIAPVFTWNAFLTISLPLTLLALSSQNATGIGVLWALGYRPPVNMVTLATGVFSIITAPFGGHGVNLATPMTAVCGDAAAHPDPDLRWSASVINGLLFALFGAMGLTVVALIQVLPTGLIKAVAGLAMVPVLLQSLEKSFGSGEHRMGNLFALVIAASNVTWLGVGAPFWALVLATAISFVVDRDWKTEKS